MKRILVLDNGGSHVKFGFCDSDAPRRIPNTAGKIKRQQRVLVGEETETLVKDFSQLVYVRPIDRGYVTDAPTQSAVWQHAFASTPEPITPSDTQLLLTSPPFVPRTVEAAMGELVFESHGFASLVVEVPAALAHRGCTASPLAVAGTGIVVDSGYSFSHVVPVHEGRPITPAIRRIDVGGKALTNYLKDAVSYRQYNMMDDTAVVNRVKEQLCYVSLAFDIELDIAKRLATPAALARVQSLGSRALPAVAAVLVAAGLPQNAHSKLRPADAGSGPGILREFVLPDYSKVMRGYVRGSSEDPALACGVPAAPPAGAASAPLERPAAPSSASPAGPAAAPLTSAAKGVVASAGVPRKRRRRKTEEVAGFVKRGRNDGPRHATKTAPTKGGSDSSGNDNGAEDGDDSDSSESSSSSEEEDAGGGRDKGAVWASKKDSEYEGASGAAGAPLPPRERTAGRRAASAGVAALTQTLRQDGALATGDEDEDAGGALESRRVGTAAVGSSSSSSDMFYQSAAGGRGGTDDSDLQILRLNGERISVPELLFRPADVGLPQAGIPGAVAEAIAACPPYLRPAMWASVLLVGGNACLSGFEARVRRELRALAPVASPVNVYTAPDPITAAWQGGARWAAEQPVAFAKRAVTRAQYADEGADRAIRRAFRA